MAADLSPVGTGRRAPDLELAGAKADRARLGRRDRTTSLARRPVRWPRWAGRLDGHGARGMSAVVVASRGGTVPDQGDVDVVREAVDGQLAAYFLLWRSLRAGLPTGWPVSPAALRGPSHRRPAASASMVPVTWRSAGRVAVATRDPHGARSPICRPRQRWCITSVNPGQRPAAFRGVPYVRHPGMTTLSQLERGHVEEYLPGPHPALARPAGRRRESRDISGPSPSPRSSACGPSSTTSPPGDGPRRPPAADVRLRRARPARQLPRALPPTSTPR